MKEYKDFMCIHSEEEKKKSEDCLQRVYKELGCGSKNLLTSIVYNLEWGLAEDFIGLIEGFRCDQWSAVSAVVQKMNNETRRYEDYADIYVQCDLVEHGIARVWELSVQSVKDN